MLQSAYVFTAFGNGALDPTGPETTPDTGGYRVFRGSCWFHESDYCRAARYTTSIFLFVLLANSDLADTVGVAHPSVNSNRPPLSALLASTLAVFRTRAALQLEIITLRHQLGVLQRSVKRPKLNRFDRFLWAWFCGVWDEWRSALCIVKPATVIAWHRKGFRLFWTWKVRRG